MRAELIGGTDMLRSWIARVGESILGRARAGMDAPAPTHDSTACDAPMRPHDCAELIAASMYLDFMPLEFFCMCGARRLDEGTIEQPSEESTTRITRTSTRRWPCRSSCR